MLKTGSVVKVGFFVLMLSVALNAYAADKPNIIFILVDDMGYMDVGFNGNKYYQTPNIDRIAREGMKFTNAYANASNCAPTRACLMSGQYSTTHGIYTVSNSDRGKSSDRRLVPHPNTTVLDTSFYTVSEMLKGAGYVTGHFGKWHLGRGVLTGPTGQGFDMNIGGNHKGSPKSYFSPYKNDKITDGPVGEYLTDRLYGEVLSFINDNKDTCFFAYLSHYAVHTPIQAKKSLKEKYDTLLPKNMSPRNPKYAAMVESVDQGVGAVLDKLDELGITDNTMIVFFSDNGGVSYITSMKPLRGYKGTYYEGGIREPMAVRWPSKVAAGTVCDEPVIGMDFYPTFKEIVNGEIPAGYKLHGVSILPLLEQAGDIDRGSLYWHAPYYLQRYKGEPELFRCTPSSAIRKGKWKMIQYFETGNIELFNLEKDLAERYDSAEFLPDTVKILLADLKAWRKEMNAPVPVKPNPGFKPLLTYSNVPKTGEVLLSNQSGMYLTNIAGRIHSAGIEKVKIRIYHDAKLYYEATQKYGDGNFDFPINLEASDKPYKIKLYFNRNSFDEVDQILDSLMVQKRASSILAPLDPKGGNKIKVYPIPSKGVITVELSDDFRVGTEIKVFSLKGVLKFSTKLQEKTLTIDLKGLGGELYILQVKNDKKVWNKKITVQ